MYQINFNKPEHVHFIGIGGISMSGLAEVLLKAGFPVSGSDALPSPLLDHLASLGADIAIGQRAENITPGIRAVVYTAAIHPDNPELSAAKKAGLPLLSRAELLGEVMANYEVSAAIAGTHGKTTTTSMASHILLAADMDPTVSVGGILPSIGGNIRVGHSPNFITEACEYTDSFLTLRPRIGVILNVEADHLDYFKDLDAIADSFHTFASRISPDGVLIINRDTQKFREVTAGLSCRILTYSMNAIADYMASDIAFDEKGCASFTCLEFGSPLGTFKLNVPGIHNVSNALSAIALGRVLGIEPETIAEGLASFVGVDRRFEFKGKMNGTAIIDDYAHHPTEIKATIQAAKACPHRELWVIFQPHTYTRTLALLDEFAEALSLADHVILADIYAAREEDIYGISSRDVAEKLARLGTDVYYFDSFEKIEQFAREHCVDNDMLITMGAGNVTNIGPALLSRKIIH
ncbi:MAG: UDP-N-acetylmuramate--L-alanine ligase [Lachnospiraceae bacterium]|nr:UDP-N-acetylmuramate--L-alanine ligase [Lachnospiraceae bacterium]